MNNPIPYNILINFISEEIDLIHTNEINTQLH
jgi:hypothetical protein